MFILDMLNYKQYMSEIDALMIENSSLQTTIRNKDEKISSLHREIETLKQFIHSHAPLFNINLIADASTFEARRHLWESCWNSIDHSSTVQQRCQLRACGAEYTPLDISPSAGIAHFHGLDSQYTTSLQKCTCEYFQRCLRPCKHMYRLAHEFDIFILNDVHYVPEPQKLLFYSQFKRIYQSLSATARSILLDLKYQYIVVSNRMDAASLLSHYFVVISSDKHSILKSYRRDELFALLPADCSLRKNARKEEIIEEIISSHPQIIQEIEKLTVPLQLSPYVFHLRSHFTD